MECRFVLTATKPPRSRAMLNLIARLDKDVSAELKCYTVDLEDGRSVDFWFPDEQEPASMDIHVEFEREE
jgi:hypothetical protein